VEFDQLIINTTAVSHLNHCVHSGHKFW